MKFKALFVFWSCFFCLAANNCCVSSGKDGITKELRSMEKDIPLPYHEALDKTMNQLADQDLPKTFKDHETFIDSALLQRNMPLELKYLPYALSGMKANYHSGDRCGYWALPSLVGMRYGLNIDENNDERLSVETSTLAALDYLNDLYKKYNDWWYSILAYANSPTSLSHALTHHGSKPELWDIYEQHMMPDNDIIANFIACVYLGNEDRLKFSSNAEASIEIEVVEPAETPTDIVETGPSTNSKTYKIKKGDTLWAIAAKHHVTVEDLMEWNQLKSDKIIEGRTLIINNQ